MSDTEETSASASPGEFNIGDVMAEINAEPDVETEASEQEPAEPAKPSAKGEKPAPAKRTVENKPEPKSEPGKLKEDFSDDRPWTPERVKAAAAEARELAASAQRQWVTEQKRAEKLKTQRDAFLQEKAQYRAVRDQLAANFQTMRTHGDVRARLEAFGQLFGGDGVELLERFNIELARGGKRVELSPTEQALKAEIEELKRERREEREQRARFAKEREQDQFIAQRKEELAQLGTDPERFPLLSEFEPEEVAEALAGIITSVYNEQGKRISDAQAAQILEQDLEEREALREQRRAARGGPKGSAGLEPRAARAAKPAQVQSSPPNRGRSLAPALSTQSLTTREVDEEEADAADLIPASLLRAANPSG